MGIESSPHHGLFAFRYSRRYKDGASLRFLQERFHFRLNVCFSQTSGALHLLFRWSRKKKLIANGGIGLSCDGQAEANTEEVGVFTFHGEAKGIVAEVVDPPLQFAIARKDVVVVAKTPQEPMLAVIEASVSFVLRSSLLRCRRSRLNTKNETPILLIGTCLKAFDNLPQVLGHLLMHKQDAMQMVWHDLQCHH